jgi:hypothetical protein
LCGSSERSMGVMPALALEFDTLIKNRLLLFKQKLKNETRKSDNSLAKAG